MCIIWLTFNLVPLEQKMGRMEEGMRLGGQAFTVVTVCIHPKGGIYQDLVGNFEGDNGFLTVWNKILTVFFKGLFFLNWKYLSELNLHKGKMKRRPVFLLLYWWSHHGMSRGKKSSSRNKLLFAKCWNSQIVSSSLTVHSVGWHHCGRLDIPSAVRKNKPSPPEEEKGRKTSQEEDQGFIHS